MPFQAYSLAVRKLNLDELSIAAATDEVLHQKITELVGQLQNCWKSFLIYYAIVCDLVMVAGNGKLRNSKTLCDEFSSNLSSILLIR